MAATLRRTQTCVANKSKVYGNFWAAIRPPISLAAVLRQVLSRIDWLGFFASVFKNGRRARMIARQPDVEKGLDATGSMGVFGIHHAGLAKLAVVAGTAAMLIALYIPTRHLLTIEGDIAEQTRAFSVDIAESCLQGTAEAPVLEAREGDRIVLIVTSLYAGALYVHGMEKELNLTPGSEARITFTVEHAGRYYLHLHGEDEGRTHAEVAVLEVTPR
jgi:hypothetical protein